MSKIKDKEEIKESISKIMEGKDEIDKLEYTELTDIQKLEPVTKVPEDELKKSYTKSPTPEQIEEIKKRVQAGARYCDVERDMRMNYDVVKRICKEAGIFSRIRKSSTKP